MKKSLSLAIIITTLLSSIVYAENAIYIYRNDGCFNAFIDSQVENISYSTIDTAGIEHNNIVTQLIQTPDSLYRIPISSIDSIAFTERPLPEIKNDVFYLTSAHLPYLTEVNDLSLSFDSSIPDELLPGEGYVIISDVYQDLLKNGFAGRVNSITTNDDQITIDCSNVSITDIYDRLIAVGSITAESVTENTTENTISATPKISASDSEKFCLPEFSCTVESLTIKNSPEARIDYTVFIEPGKTPVISMLLYHNHNISVNVKHSAEGESAPDPTWRTSEYVRLPYGFYLNLDFGTFWQSLGRMDLSFDQTYKIGFVNGFSYDENGLTLINRITKSEFENPTADIELDGSFTTGLAASFSLGFIAEKLLSVNGTIKEGFQLASTFSMKDYDLTTLMNDGAVYDILKEVKVKLNSYDAIEAEYNIVGFEGSINSEGLQIPSEYTGLIKEWHLLPQFSTPKVSISDDKSSITVSTQPSCDLIMPVKLGIGLKESGSDSPVDVYLSDQPYSNQSEYPSTEVCAIFTEIDAAKDYVAFPVVEFLETTMHATPESEILAEESNDDITSGKEVDLGLSVKWAGWNIDASSPEGYGGYYAWGETERKYLYTRATYIYWHDENYDGKYTESEIEYIGDEISGTQYDVATQKWGNGWRMPTKDEIQELYDNCTKEPYSYNGVVGIKFTGPNGNSIFLPCAGTRGSYETANGVGKNAYYWSGTKNETFNMTAYNMDMYYKGTSYKIGGTERNYGMPIRAVRK